jgi:hypothetical protein
MGIIVANGPALKVWYGRTSFPSFWPTSLPSIKLVWSSTSSETDIGSTNINTKKRSIFDRIPRISTIQQSGFHITEMISQTETLAAVHSTEFDDKHWDDRVGKPQKAYYGV